MTTFSAHPSHVATSGQPLFPADAPVEEQLRFLVEFATLAPSSHNSQPWLFGIDDGAIELFADRSRSLPVVDPDDRALVMSCAAALYHLRVAATHFGFVPLVQVLPNGPESDLLARFKRGDRIRSVAPTRDLFGVLRERHTDRQPFDDRPVDPDITQRLVFGAAEEGAWLIPIAFEDEKERLADLIAEGDEAQFADPEFRKELSAWLRSNHSHQPDGMPGYARGMGDAMSMAAAWVVRTFDIGHNQANADSELARHAPLLVVLGTDGNTVADWLNAGQALDRILLTAAAEGLHASFLNQPIEVPSLRPKVMRLIQRTQGHPQLILRFGYGHAERPTPRRAADDVILH
ncbi:MAG: nitroreductase family protein [Dehalococcoidia bacterium]|nr:nitroreductase family protein [Dehalococcoidia bacterium]